MQLVPTVNSEHESEQQRCHSARSYLVLRGALHFTMVACSSSFLSRDSSSSGIFLRRSPFASSAISCGVACCFSTGEGL